MNTQEYEFHPYANVVPMLGQVELNALAADIQSSGLRQPIVLLDGKILDGRNRYQACLLVGVEPEFREFNGEGDPIDYIVSMNLCRRQLTASQKALAVARIADLPRGNPNLKSSKTPTTSKRAQMPNRKTITEVAKEVEISPRTVKQAKQVLREAPNETIEKVERGEKSVATAVKEIKEEKAKAHAKEERHLDKTGYPIPDAILADWQRAEAFKSNLQEISRIKGELSKGLDDKDPIFIRESSSSAVSMLQNLYAELKCIIPYAVCTSCQGKQRTKCSLCKGSGFISQFAYNQFVPAETKELRKKVVQK